MKKMMIMILLSVTVLCSAGCSAGKDMGAAEAVTASKVAEASTGEAVETGKADTSKENESLSSEEIRTLEEAQEPPAEPQHAVQEDGTAQEQEESSGHKAPEQKKQDVKQKNPQETDSSVEKKPSDSERKHADDISEKTAQQPRQSAQQQQPDSQTKAQPAQQSQPEPKQEAKGYSPQNVVSLATAKTKAYGKVTLTDNLNSLLAEGAITQEEYNEYYPYDGAGYYSVFVQTDLNRASTTSGKSLSSEDAIAQYIADMLGLESGQYFLIEYVGTYSTGGEDFYEFRCYRA